MRNLRVPSDQSGVTINDFCQTRNISHCGAYCVCSRPIPEFTRLHVTLELQEPGSDRKEDVECEGVVVRSEGKRQMDGRTVYAFAIFFDRISEEARKKIDLYVQKHSANSKPSGPEPTGDFT